MLAYYLLLDATTATDSPAQEPVTQELALVLEMDGLLLHSPQSKRKRTEFGLRTTASTADSKFVVDDDISGSDEDIIFISEKTTTLRSSPGLPLQNRPRNTWELSGLRKPKSTSQSSKATPSVRNAHTTKVRALQIGTVQTTLTDFFKSKNASSSASSLQPIANGDPRLSDASDFSVHFPGIETKTSVRCGERLLLQSKTSISSFTTIASNVKSGIKTESFPEELEYSSGDELLASIPDSLLNPVVPQSFRAVQSTKKVFVNPTASATISSNKTYRKCPFYKLLPGTPFAVDAFNFGIIPNVRAYFLSHFHSDHYYGLLKSFSQPIYCSKITANLIREKIRVDARYINALPMDTPCYVDNVEVTLLDANHCPGSAVFLFRLQDGRVYLHTGDFRADPAVMAADPHLQNMREVSKVYLDTTYLDPYYEFESQAQTVEYATELALQAVAKNPKTLVVCGTYSIGKEKVFMRIAEALNCKVAVTANKLRILQCFEWSELDAMLTKDWNAAQVHVLPMQSLDFRSLTEHLGKYARFNAVLAIIPSGWQFNKKLVSLRDIKPKVSGAVSLVGLPYSEHSSYRELEWFIHYIRPKEIIPTVNVGNPTRRKEMDAILKTWLSPAFKPAPSKKQNLITDFCGK